MNWWVTDVLNFQGPAVLVSWIVLVLGSIILHELGHGWAAIRSGDQTPIYTGHMTWNPLVHMGSTSLIVFALAGIAWGQMPVDPSRFRRRKDDAFVAFAGPAMNLGILLICLILGSLWIAFADGKVPERAFNNIDSFFCLAVKLNVVLLVLNLIPVPPLDGSTILATYSQGYRNLLRNPNASMIGLLVFVVIFFKFGRFIWTFADTISSAGYGFLLQVLT